MKKILCLLIFFAFYSFVFAQNQNNSPSKVLNQQDSVKTLRSDLNTLKYEFEVVKRDKLNYEIEKNILKDSFSNHMQVINIVLATLLLFFSIIGAIFGYVGFKNISHIRRKFESELNSLLKLKSTYENRFKDLDSGEKAFNERMIEIEKINLTQSKKIRILELKNNIREAMKDKNYNHALNLIEVGLEEEPDDYNLNAMKSDSYSVLKNYRKALNSTLKALRIAETSKKEMILVNVYNLLEFSLMLKDISFYEKYKQKYIEYLKYETINVYFEGLVLFIKDERENMINIIIDYFNTSPKLIIFPGWSFCAGQSFINKNKENSCYDTFYEYIEILCKKKGIEDFIENHGKN